MRSTAQIVFGQVDTIVLGRVVKTELVETAPGKLHNLPNYDTEYQWYGTFY